MLSNTEYLQDDRMMSFWEKALFLLLFIGDICKKDTYQDANMLITCAYLSCVKPDKEFCSKHAIYLIRSKKHH